MRIQHNISAINTARQLANNDNAISKNLQRLSSGYRINSAADDAAGLAISEKMRSQINGLNQAENNAEDGISLVKTGEGNLNETTAILQRMNELAVESSNGTYQDGTDRTNLNKEVEALKTEIDRISTSTNFNKINLLDGSLSNEGATVTDASFVSFTNGEAATAGQAASATFDFSAIASGSAVKDKTITVGGTTYTFVTGGAVGNQISLGDDDATAAALSAGDVADLVRGLAVAGYGADSNNGDTTVVFTQSTPSDVTLTSADFGKGNALSADPVLVNGKAASAGSKAAFSIDFAGKTGKNVIGTTLNIDGRVYEFTTGSTVKGDATNTAVSIAAEATAGDIATTLSNKIGTLAGYDTAVVADGQISYAASDVGVQTPVEVRQGSADGIIFQIGSDATANQRVNLQVSDMSAKGLGLESISIGSQPDALAAIDKITAAINTVSATRADFGALQNRLEHTVNNLSTTSENLTSAESRIRDVDMSTEMVEMTKNQILSQAATAMLAQANTQPQGVLQLLR